MRLKLLSLLACIAWLGTHPAAAQVVALNPSPTRVIGTPTNFDPIRPAPVNGNPNLVEGRELNSPFGVALDLNASPYPLIYISDSGNNRILVWQYRPGLGDPNSGSFPPADLVIGQPDLYTTRPSGPAAGNAIGLSGPTGLAVDGNGSLYVVDSGNNRILRFPRRFDPTVNQVPDLVLGQSTFNTNVANLAGISAKTIALNGNAASLAFDNSGNLYFTDVLNNRVLRYAAPDLSAGTNGAAANLVLGQNSFSTTDGPTQALGTDRLPVKDKLGNPLGLALDSRGRLYVSDAPNNLPRRVLVYAPNPSANGTSAIRVMGLVVNSSPATQDRDNKTVFGTPQSVFLTSDDRVGVVDSSFHRIMLFGTVDSWPAETTTAPSPQATAVIGQANDFSKLTRNNGNQEASASTFATPVYAVFRNDELFVADAGNHRILVMQPQGNSFAPAYLVFGQDQFNYDSVNLIEGREFRFVTQISNSGLLADGGVVVDTNANPPHLYVADTYNNRILGFNDVRAVRPGVRADLVIGQPDMFRSVCNYGTNSGTQPDKNTLCNPVGLALDSGGNLWVADSGNSRVLRFPSPFAQQGFLPSADTVCGQPDFKSQIRAPSQMWSPYGLAIDPDGRLLVSDSTYSRVLIFENVVPGACPQPAKVLGQPNFNSITFGNGLDQMHSPQHISVDSSGRLYVADAGNGRILIFPPTAFTVSGDLALDISISGLNNPNAVSVNQQTGEVWVADTNNSRILRYPNFDSILLGNGAANLAIQEYAPTIALTQDQFGNLYVAEASNRIAIHYPNLLSVNAANLLVDSRTGVPFGGLAPGMLASICPPLRELAIACRADDPAQFLDPGSSGASNTDLPNPYPLPNTLADTQVLLNGNPVPLIHVDPQKINFQVPKGVTTHDDALLEVVRASTGQTLGSGTVRINDVSPGLFYCDPANLGTCTPTKTKPLSQVSPTVNVYQAIAANADGSVNSESNPAARSTVISLFGTGQGLLDGSPDDGQVSPDGVTLPDGRTQVIINITPIPAANIKFSGLAPGMVGVWRIDVQIPDLVPPGNAPVYVVLNNSVRGTDPTRLLTTIAVKQ